MSLLAGVLTPDSLPIHDPRAAHSASHSHILSSLQLLCFPHMRTLVLYIRYASRRISSLFYGLRTLYRKRVGVGGEGSSCKHHDPKPETPQKAAATKIESTGKSACATGEEGGGAAEKHRSKDRPLQRPATARFRRRPLQNPGRRRKAAPTCVGPRLWKGKTHPQESCAGTPSVRTVLDWNSCTSGRFARRPQASRWLYNAWRVFGTRRGPCSVSVC